MKKYYSLILVALCALLSFDASASLGKKVSFKTDAASSGLVTLVDVNNNINVVLTETAQTLYGLPDDGYFDIQSAEGYYVGGFTTIKTDGTNGYSEDWKDQKASEGTGAWVALNDGDVVTVTAIDPATIVANTVTFVGPADGYYIYSNKDYNNYYPDEDGKVELDYGQYSVTINHTNGYAINNITNQNGETFAHYGTYASIYIGNLTIGDEITLDMSKPNNEVTFVINGQNAYKASIKQNGNSIEPKLGEFKVSFNTGDYFQISYAYTWDGGDLYRVLLNDNEQTAINKIWTIYPQNGDVITIDIDCPVVAAPAKITLGEGVGTDIVKSVKVDYDPVDVSVWSAADWTVNTGSKVQVELDNVAYSNLSVKLNGEPFELPSWGPYIEFTPTEATGFNLELNGKKATAWQVSIAADYPDGLYVWHGSYPSGDPIALTFTNNVATLDVYPANNQLYFGVEEGDYKLGAITVDGVAISGQCVTVTGENMIEVEMSLIERNNTAVIYFDPNASWGYKSVYLYNKTTQVTTKTYDDVLPTGYNFINFSDDEGIKVSAVNSNYSNAQAYLNDELGTQTWGSYSFDDVEHNDVIKVYTSTPDVHQLEYAISDKVNVNIKHDHVKGIETPGTHNVLPGTIVHISMAETQKQAKADAAEETAGIIVKVNDTELKADDQGVYSFTVNGATKVSVEPMPTGISEIGAAAAAEATYNLQGIRVEAEQLPAGIYIRGGKKFIVK